MKVSCSRNELWNCYLLPNLAHQITSLVGSNAAADDRTTDTASATERHFGGDVDLL
jgi:hypothetical protein